MSDITCTRCGTITRSLNGWWLRTIASTEWLCPVCTLIIMSDDSDHGDEHVESAEGSAALHADKIEHQTRVCRMCIGAGAPLRPDVRWRWSAPIG